jgi:N-glycosylase/DNA lyase
MNSKNIVTITSEDFSIEQILECGQCFRFHKLDMNDYIIVAYNKMLRVKQMENEIQFHCDKEDYNNLWTTYFDMDRDYNNIKQILSKKDEHLERAIKEKYGIRLLKQDPWETLISFIISQNKQIPHIKKIISDLSREYGELIGENDGVGYYSFPTNKQLANVTEEELRNLKVGFRAPYLMDAINKIKEKQIVMDSIYDMDYLEAKKVLMSIKGVGNKVADCVLLFGYGKYEVFPTDVWVKRIMEYYYFEEETKIDIIHSFAKDHYKEYAGFAQQYLFYYARDNRIGKEKSRNKE